MRGWRAPGPISTTALCSGATPREGVGTTGRRRAGLKGRKRGRKGGIVGVVCYQGRGEEHREEERAGLCVNLNLKERGLEKRKRREM